MAEKSTMLIFQPQHLRDEKTLQKLVTKLSSTFETYKPDKAIMQYLNQHTRQLGPEAPSFANPKEKQHSSNKFEKQKSASSDRKKNRTDRSDKKTKANRRFRFQNEISRKIQR